ncbi:MAG: hypothetical protein AB7P13_03175 [Candidatus Nitrosocosmicus sp.]
MSIYNLGIGSTDDVNSGSNIVFAQANTSNLTATNPMIIDNTFTTTGVNKGEDTSVFPAANFTLAMGTIASIQNNESGEPTWILSGNWELLLPESLKGNKVNSSDATAFNAEFEMVRIDGTQRHIHTVSDFKITGIQVTENTLVLDGWATVLLNGPLKEAPVSISIQDQDLLKLWIKSTEATPEPKDYHFGKTPIYGVLSAIDTSVTYP